MNIVTREAQTGDSKFIADLCGQLGYEATSDEMVQRLLEISENKDSCVFVACCNDRVVGWVHGFYAPRIEYDSFVEIGGMVVDEEYRSKGIGKMLIGEVIKWTRLKKINKLRVRSKSVRLRTHEFYKNFGFKEIKDQKVFDLDV